MNALLKWGIQVAIITFAAFMINQYGWWELLYNTDTTNISFVIVGVFLLSSLSIGFISLQSTDWDHIDRFTNYVQFSSELMNTLGVIGAIAGILFALNTAVNGLDVFVGISNSLITILVGLICSTTIKLQMMLYENT
jgi:hypothetical protein|tara:strand:+ start:2106 stop:2516 length:411 start_codon:yes stop_codon:yes gene_type:complete